MPFKPVPTRVDYVTLEHDVQAFWDAHDIPNRYMQRNQAADKRWSFIDGPITANNPMGVHHAWGRSYKDLYNRFWTMRGYKLRYQNGFDGQGLWIEVEVEKEKGFRSKHEIERFGVAEFVEACKQRRQLRSRCHPSARCRIKCACAKRGQAERAQKPRGNMIGVGSVGDLLDHQAEQAVAEV